MEALNCLWTQEAVRTIKSMLALCKRTPASPTLHCPVSRIVRILSIQMSMQHSSEHYY